MARIRSIHPGQWTDAEFVRCSAFARLLALAIRNEADDQGVFEWKPDQIKLRLFPSDDVDVVALLAELVRTRQVLRYEAGGKRYGLIRNFAAYQRPKTPTNLYPSPPNGVVFPECPPDGGEFPEISPRRMEGKDEGEETPLSPNGDAPLTATDPAVQAIEAFNAVAAELDLPKAQAINASRRRAVTRRLRECGGIEGWFAALAKIRGSPFCQGQNNRGWRLGLDALCQPKTFTKLMEGAYDPREPKPDDNRSAARAAVFGVLHDATLRDAGPGGG